MHFTSKPDHNGCCQYGIEVSCPENMMHFTPHNIDTGYSYLTFNLADGSKATIAIFKLEKY